MHVSLCCQSVLAAGFGEFFARFLWLLEKKVYRPVRFVEFTEYSEDILESVLRRLAEAAGSPVSFTVKFANLLADCTLIEFLPGRAVRFHVPSQLLSVDRLNFFTNLFTWQMFAFVKERLLSCPEATVCPDIHDWNWEAVRTGTLTSLQVLNMSVLFSLEIRTTLDNSHPKVAFTESDWHNGYLIAIIQQPQPANKID
jgi:hypothetical protein